MENNQQNKLTKWLNKLQRESWQLELVISGFSIFLMAAAYDWLREFKREIDLVTDGIVGNTDWMSIVYSIVVGACFFVLINLVLHVMLRGLWISTIGLRYVSGDIDFDKLKLAPKFDRLLRRKIGSFDQYILQLENICSVIFSFTFLIVFMLLAFGLYIFFLLLVANVVLSKVFMDAPDTLAASFVGIFIIVFFISGLLYFLDFITLGFLKRIKWFSHVYIPIYRFLSTITLSFLYRPIYYNLIDNKFGRRVGLLLVPYVVIVIFLMSERIRSHIWYPNQPGTLALVNHDYDDQRKEKHLIKSGSIPSKFIRNGFLELFIAYSPRDDDSTLGIICPDFEPFGEPGFHSDIKVNGRSKFDDRENARDTAIVCLSQLYEIQIDDSLFYNNRFRYFRHQNLSEYGLITMMDVGYLSRGEHLVKVRKWGTRKDSLVMKDFFEIPFWME